MKKLICTALIFSVIFISSCASRVSTQAKISDNPVAKAEVTAEVKPEVKAEVTPEVSVTKKKTEIKTIVIDPGHASKANLNKEATAPGSSVMKIKDGGGATGILTHTPEYAVNMKVALKLKNILEAQGYRVVMTKSENSVSLGNIDRAQVGNSENAALVIRIHADSSTSSSINGASLLVPEKINSNTKAIGDISLKYGKIILNTLTTGVGMKSNGVVPRSDMTGFNWSKVPVVLVEMGFLSNEKEDKLLSTDSYQNKIADALAKGIKVAVPN